MATRYDYVHGRHKSIFVRNMYKVLQAVKRNINYLKEHPKQLAWVMYEYTKLDWASRFEEEGDSYHGNPKYPILEFGDELGDEKIADLVYDAWGAGIDNYDQITKYSKLECKVNKTMDDWLKIKLDPNYRYKSIYPTKKSVECHMLCTIGAGYTWNEDGYLCDRTPSYRDATVFYNFQLVGRSVPEKIKDKIPHLKDEQIQKAFKSYKRHMKRSYDKQYGEKSFMKKHKEEYIQKVLKIYPNKKRKDLEKLDTFELLDMWIDSLEGDLKDKKKRKEQQEKRRIEREKKKREEQIAHSKYYPMSENYSPFCTMPDNTHESYIKTGIGIAARILGNPYEEIETYTDRKTNKTKTYKRENPALAIKFLQKWGEKYPEYTNEVFEDVEKLWEEFPWMFQEMKDYGLIKEEVCQNLSM